MFRSAAGKISYLTRAQDLASLEGRVFDLLILGGGINGAGVAREAALRGLNVVLVEAYDFAEGTSSRSSKLIHGGIRYLENLEFGLVFESLNERNRLFDLAPHLVHPLKFVLPIYQESRHPMWKISLGMWLYDVLSLFEAPETHQRLGKKELLADYPYLRREGLLGGFSYYDAYTEDDRLVLETLRSAAATGHARLINHCAALPELESSGECLKMKVRDKFTDQTHQVRARHIVSTLGPWTDFFAKEWLSGWRPVLRPTKGIHLVFSKDRFPVHHAVVMNDDVKGRIVFVLPREEFVLLGTTDTDFPHEPSGVKVEPDDVSYLLKMAAEYFPKVGLTREDVVSCYAGVRPLFDDQSGSETKTSREHHIFSVDPGVTFVTGGKFTTYRRIAEEAVEAALARFPLEQQVRFSRSYSEQPLNPAVTWQRYGWAQRQTGEWSKRFQLAESEVKYLVQRYGAEAFTLLNEFDKSPSSEVDQRVAQMEARFAIHHTGCMSVSDFLMRRTSHFLRSRDHGLALWDVVADCFVEEMGLDPDQLVQDRHKFEEQIQREHRALSV